VEPVGRLGCITRIEEPSRDSPISMARRRISPLHNASYPFHWLTSSATVTPSPPSCWSPGR
jgi:hypothetical protein